MLPAQGLVELSLDEKVRQRFVAAARAAGFLDASRPPSDDEAIPE
jgi:hypothetical protein